MVNEGMSQSHKHVHKFPLKASQKRPAEVDYRSQRTSVSGISGHKCGRCLVR